MPERMVRLLRALVPYGLVVTVGGVAFLILHSLRGDKRVELHDPYALLLLAGCLLASWTGFHLHARRAASFTFSRVGDLAQARPGLVAHLRAAPRALRVVALGLIAAGLARPQTFTRQVTEVEGIDIMLVLDLSRSMEERDLDRRRDRLDVAKRTILNFLSGRGQNRDRIGLVVFGKQAMTQCPLTLDYGALATIVSSLQLGDIDGMGTAIGDAMGLAVASLRRSDAKSKVAILLTDGDSNIINVMSPEEALALAKDRGIRVFTALMGREQAAAGRRDPFGRRSHGTNPALLQRLAAETGGRYFNATEAAQLDAGFDEVRATLEKSKRSEVRRLPYELFPPWVAVALGLLLVETTLSLTRLRRFP